VLAASKLAYSLTPSINARNFLEREG